MEEFVLVLLLVGLFVGAFLIHGQRVFWGLTVMIGSVVIVWLWDLWVEICQIPDAIKTVGEKVKFESK